jgi:hypothetical protein
MPVISSNRNISEILLSEMHAMKLEQGETASMLAPQGTPFEQLRAYIDKQEEKMYLAVDAMFLKTASKDEHGRQSGVALQKTDDAGAPRMNSYKRGLEDALEKLISVIKFARGEEENKIEIHGLIPKKEKTSENPGTAETMNDSESVMMKMKESA